MSSIENGLRAQDTSREEGWQEDKGRQECVQREACAHATGSPRKRDRIIYIENSSNVREPFVLEKIATVEDVLQGICSKFPEICLESIGMKISASRTGTLHRTLLTGEIPYEADTLYIQLYLKKHPPVAYSKN